MTYRFKLIVFNVEKSENIGMLIRSAYAFGCGELLVVGKPKYKVTGARGTQQVQAVRKFPNLQEAVDYCRASGYRICGLEIGGTPITEARFDHNVAFLMGNEGRGMGDTTEYCDHVLTIPQWGGVPSLNVAVAGAIAMFEFQKRQGLPGAQIEGERYYDDFFVTDTTKP